MADLEKTIAEQIKAFKEQSKTDPDNAIGNFMALAMESSNEATHKYCLRQIAELGNDNYIKDQQHPGTFSKAKGSLLFLVEFGDDNLKKLSLEAFISLGTKYPEVIDDLTYLTRIDQNNSNAIKTQAMKGIAELFGEHPVKVVKALEQVADNVNTNKSPLLEHTRLNLNPLKFLIHGDMDAAEIKAAKDLFKAKRAICDFMGQAYLSPDTVEKQSAINKIAELANNPYEHYKKSESTDLDQSTVEHRKEQRLYEDGKNYYDKAKDELLTLAVHAREDETKKMALKALISLGSKIPEVLEELAYLTRTNSSSTAEIKKLSTEGIAELSKQHPKEAKQALEYIIRESIDKPSVDLAQQYLEKPKKPMSNLKFSHTTTKSILGNPPLLGNVG